MHLAVQGDREAFGELVRRHRSRMLGWARHLVKQSAAAEDIVQEALLHSYNRLHTLREPEKFAGWLRAIVRNQALMELRRAGKEYPAGAAPWNAEESAETFSSLLPSGQDQHGMTAEEAMLAERSWEEVQRLLSRIGDQERRVMYAHALTGRSVPETAEALGMKSGAIYTALSRGRRKLVEVRLDDEIEQYVSARKRRAAACSAQIPSARYHWFAGAHHTMAAMMLETMLASGQRGVSLTDVMGATGQAFRLYAAPRSGLSSVYAYDWGRDAQMGWRHLGFHSSVHGGAGQLLTRPEPLLEAMEQMQASIERGIPVMAWNVASAEFGLISGFDDRRAEWHVTDTTAHRKPLPYRKFGRLHPGAEWFVSIPGTRRPVLPQEMLHQVLLQTVRHARGEEPAFFDGSPIGLGAYESWRDALRNDENIDMLTVAFHSAYVAEARTHAAHFLEQRLLNGMVGSLCRSAVPALQQALLSYRDTAEAWRQLSRIFPLTQGGRRMEPGPRERATRLLERACRAEEKAVEALEEASAWLERVQS